MKRKKKLMAGIALGLTLALGCAAPAMADSRKVVTLGANLTTEQQNTMMRYFGVSSDSVDIIYINNTQEREQLLAYVPEEKIGTRTYSCALVLPTSSGGIQVKTANLNWVTCNMIASTLSTSGVTNCQVVAASPFEVSGTGALTGVILAYETASDTTLDPVKKNLANEELVQTGNLSDRVGPSKATAVINQTKIKVIENHITDIDQITNIINDVSVTYNVTIEDDESEEIAELMQKIAEQEYDIVQLKATLDQVQNNVAADAGASEEEQAALESEAEESMQAAQEAALDQVADEESDTEAEEDETEADVMIVTDSGESEVETEETENILNNTDSSALTTDDGSEVEEGSTLQTVQEQSESEEETSAESGDVLVIPETTQEETTASENGDVIVIPEATGDETNGSESGDVVVVVDEPTTEPQAGEDTETNSADSGVITVETGDVIVTTESETTDPNGGVVVTTEPSVEIGVTVETGDIPEATGDLNGTQETSAEVTLTDDPTAETAAEETLTPDMLDSEDRSTYDSAVQGIDSEFSGDQVVSSDGSTTVYLTSDAAQKVPDAIEAYVLKVLAKGGDTVAAEEAADASISQNIMAETQSLAADPNYSDSDLRQIDKYVRRLVLQDSEGMLAESQLTDLDKQVVYGAVMDQLESAFDVEQPVEETAETTAEELSAENTDEWTGEAEEAVADEEEWSDEYGVDDILSDLEEYY